MAKKTFALPILIIVLAGTLALAAEESQQPALPSASVQSATTNPADNNPSTSGILLKDRLKQAGVFGWIQIGLSIFGGGFVVERLVHLRRPRIFPIGRMAAVRELWKEGDFSSLEALADFEPSTFNRAVSFIVSHRDLPASDIASMAQDIVGNEMDAHLQKAYPCGVIATLQPLLGLMGMVMGMIQSFEMVALAGALGNPAQLASGISEALLTTLLGIGFAIPFLACFHYFKNKAAMLHNQLEEAITELCIEWLINRPLDKSFLARSGQPV